MLLELDAVTRSYDDVEVLAGVSLTLDRGERLTVVGPSGCGKSTLLNLAGALDQPDGGHVRLDGQDVAALNARARAGLRNAHIGFVFQLHHLLPQCSVLENVLVPTIVSGANAADRGRDLLERAGLGSRLDHFPGQLSGGERQRVAVVRALINGPDLLLADEPTGSLDGDTAERLTDLLLELQDREGFGLIVVTHADRLAARVGNVRNLRHGHLE